MKNHLMFLPLICSLQIPVDYNTHNLLPLSKCALPELD